MNMFMRSSPPKRQRLSLDSTFKTDVYEGLNMINLPILVLEELHIKYRNSYCDWISIANDLTDFTEALEHLCDQNQKSNILESLLKCKKTNCDTVVESILKIQQKLTRVRILFSWVFDGTITCVFLWNLFQPPETTTYHFGSANSSPSSSSTTSFAGFPFRRFSGDITGMMGRRASWVEDLTDHYQANQNESKPVDCDWVSLLQGPLNFGGAFMALTELQESDFRILASTTALQKLWNMDSKPTNGSSIGFSELEISRIIHYLHNIKAGGNKFSPSQLTFQSKVLSLEAKYLHGNQFLLCVEQPQTSQNLLNHVEVLEKKNVELERLLQAKSRSYAQMLQSIADECRIPLNGMTSVLSLLTESSLNDPSSVYSILINYTDQITKYLDDLLDLAKLSENKLMMDNTLFSIITLLENAVISVFPQAQKKGVELVCDFMECSEEFAFGDSQKIQKVLHRVLTNAIKWSSKGDIELKVVAFPLPGNDYVQYDFTIQEESLTSEKLSVVSELDCEPTLYRLSPSELSLYVSKLTLESMGGRMWVEPPRGTEYSTTLRFSVPVKKELPFSPPAAPGGTPVNTSRPSETSNNNNVSKSRTILIATPSLIIGQALQKLCEALGYSVFIATSESQLSMLVGKCVSKFYTWNQSQGTQTDSTPHYYSRTFNVIILDTKFGTDALSILRNHTDNIVLTGYQPLKGVEGVAFVKKPLIIGGRSSTMVNLTCILNQLTNQTTEETEVTKTEVSQQLTSLKSRQAILVVEDNEINQKILVKLLHTLGYHDIQVADNGLRAIEALKSRDFDIILMDIMMPEMDGLEATRRIRCDFPPDKQPRVVAVSANAFADEKISWLAAGMDEVLQKPVTKSLLQKTLKKYFA